MLVLIINSYIQVISGRRLENREDEKIEYASTYVWHKQLDEIGVLTGHDIDFHDTDQEVLKTRPVFQLTRIKSKYALEHATCAPTKHADIPTSLNEVTFLCKGKFWKSWQRKVLKNHAELREISLKKSIVHYMRRSQLNLKAEVSNLKAEIEVQYFVFVCDCHCDF